MDIATTNVTQNIYSSIIKKSSNNMQNNIGAEIQEVIKINNHQSVCTKIKLARWQAFVLKTIEDNNTRIIE